MVHAADNPDGLPESKLHPKHVRELRNANLLLHRVVELALAARRSPARARISFEQPAVRSDRSSIAYAPDLAHHGSILATTEFKRLIKELGMEKCTFAYCRLGKEFQKYTTIFYTPELGPVLDALNTADYQCNHPRCTHSARIRGRDANGGVPLEARRGLPSRAVRDSGAGFHSSLLRQRHRPRRWRHESTADSLDGLLVG